MIARQIERLKRSRRIEGFVVATSDDRTDDALAALLALDGVAVHRGPLDDVLARYAGALERYPAQVVVRLTGDCPLADPQVIDATIDLLMDNDLDYAANTPAHRTYPKGLDVEVTQYRFMTVPKGTPAEVKDRLVEGMKATFATEGYQEFNKQNSLTPMELSGEEVVRTYLVQVAVVAG